MLVQIRPAALELTLIKSATCGCFDMAIVQRLQSAEIDEAAGVFKIGLRLQMPSEKGDLEKIKKTLQKRGCNVYKDKGRIKGLVYFEKFRNDIRVRFICAIALRQGIGSALMLDLAKHAKREGIRWIRTAVFIGDKRDRNFYDALGFVPYRRIDSTGMYLKVRPKVLLNRLKY